MRAEEVLRFSGILSLAQLAMRSEPDPAATLHEIADLKRLGFVSIDPNQTPSDLDSIAEGLEKKPAREQLRELQNASIADARVELVSSG